MYFYARFDEEKTVVEYDSYRVWGNYSKLGETWQVLFVKDSSWHPFVFRIKNGAFSLGIEELFQGRRMRSGKSERDFPASAIYSNSFRNYSICQGPIFWGTVSLNSIKYIENRKKLKKAFQRRQQSLLCKHNWALIQFCKEIKNKSTADFKNRLTPLDSIWGRFWKRYDPVSLFTFCEGF